MDDIETAEYRSLLVDVPESSLSDQIKGSLLMEDILSREKIEPFSPRMIKLYRVLAVAWLCSVASGFDANTFGGLMALEQFRDYFDLKTGGMEGILTSIYIIGNMLGALVAGPIADTYGRRRGMGIGSVVSLFGVILQALASNTTHLLIGRFVLGYGISILQISGAAYCVEIAHPAYRGAIAGFHQTCFFVGTSFTTWLEFGLNFLTNTSIAWRLPLILQAAPTIVILSYISSIPETPRWLVSVGRDSDAFEVLTRLHAEGNKDGLLVATEMREMESVIQLDGTDKRWWDVSDLFKTRQGRYRMFLVACVSFFGAWNIPPTSYYLPLMVREAGITSVSLQLFFNALQTPLMFLGSVNGSRFVDSVGRRKLFMSSSVGMCLSISCLTACSALQKQYPQFGFIGITFIYVFLLSYSIGFAPLSTVYPTELSTYNARAKTLAAFQFAAQYSKFLQHFTSAHCYRSDWISDILLLSLLGYSGFGSHLFYICRNEIEEFGGN